jgi:hypothetical protein
MRFLFRFPRRTHAGLAGVLLAASIAAAGCGNANDGHRDDIARDLGVASAAYTTYISEPAQSGQLGPTTPKSSPTSDHAAQAARYAMRALEDARAKAADDPQLASFAQKTAAASASLSAVTQVLERGRPNRTVIAGGMASLESLNAAARDLGITVGAHTVSAADLAAPAAGS